MRSALAQTHADWRMAVVDDGSTDATASIAGDFDDPRIRVLRQRNAGASAARNRGLAELDADAFLFLDADDWLAPSALADLVRTLATAPDAAAANGAACFVDSAGGPGTRRRLHPVRGDVLAGLLVRNRFANGGHLLIRNAALRAAGRFRTDLTYGEDWEVPGPGSPPRAISSRSAAPVHCCGCGSVTTVPTGARRRIQRRSARAWTPSSAIPGCGPASLPRGWFGCAAGQRRKAPGWWGVRCCGRVTGRRGGVGCCARLPRRPACDGSRCWRRPVSTPHRPATRGSCIRPA